MTGRKSVAFKGFLRKFPAQSGSDLSAVGPLGADGLAPLGYGVWFGRGIVRLHTFEQSQAAARMIRNVFPEYGESLVPVACDWLGRQYVLRAGSEKMLLMEPGSGEAFIVPTDPITFFAREAISDPDVYFASSLFDEWLAAGGRAAEDGRCVGFKVPLFLGGKGEIENLENSDEEVYWSICGQLKAALG